MAFRYSPLPGEINDLEVAFLLKGINPSHVFHIHCGDLMGPAGKKRSSGREAAEGCQKSDK